MLAVFDNNGTLCDTQEVEGRCYVRAIERIAGKSLATLDWTTYAEPTSSALLRVAGWRSRSGGKGNRDQGGVRPSFGRGAAEISRKFFADRRRRRIHRAVKGREMYAFAGNRHRLFDTSARSAPMLMGSQSTSFPMPPGSDTPRRRDIISLAASRAGFDLRSVVYFGDVPVGLSGCGHLGDSNDWHWPPRCPTAVAGVKTHVSRLL